MSSPGDFWVCRVFVLFLKMYSVHLWDPVFDAPAMTQCSRYVTLGFLCRVFGGWFWFAILLPDLCFKVTVSWKSNQPESFPN